MKTSKMGETLHLLPLWEKQGPPTNIHHVGIKETDIQLKNLNSVCQFTKKFQYTADILPTTHFQVMWYCQNTVGGHQLLAVNRLALSTQD